MNQFTNKEDVITGRSSGTAPTAARELMNSFIIILIKFGILKEES